MKHLHIFKQTKIENKGQEYNLVIYRTLRRNTRYIVSIFGNKEEALECEKGFVNKWA